MNGQEQIISSRKNWTTPSLTILTRKGEQENILGTRKMELVHGPTSGYWDCIIDNEGSDCTSINVS